ncbi:hypothetical protein DM01DRAFT_1335490 [Hesseltinella vesiculosa]|uniref:Glycerophosphocholine acyltransferase 1 n=1 Tax=Hesseltinella vesiculosa TaxID=101127 RepID=A0A1X2GJP2_9FUNG|nr:hypothetical protein DM01DRAFT_1335490 [Hesseltinella vesiculosa]
MTTTAAYDNGSSSDLDHDDVLFQNDLDTIDEWTATTHLLSENDFDMIDLLSTALDQVTLQLNQKRRDLQKKSSEWTTKTKDRIKAQTTKLEQRRDTLRGKLVARYESLNARMNRDAETVRLRDKISFVVGVGNACITPALTARAPTWVPLFYTLQSSYLLTLRAMIYRYRGWHYFIFDLCYFVNAMTLLFVWLMPSSRPLFLATYTLTSGPVAWAIITWRNSLVFHSLDKVTSVFIHIFPALVTYVIRWLPEIHPDTAVGQAYRDQRFPALHAPVYMTFKETMVYSTCAYLVWQALYYVFIMVRRREKVESGLRVTSYSWLLNDQSAKPSLLKRVAYTFGPQYKAYMFMLIQLIYNILTCIPTYFMFKHFALHTIFLCAMFAASVWNGSCYYMEVFSRRYQLEIEQAVSPRQTAPKESSKQD